MWKRLAGVLLSLFLAASPALSQGDEKMDFGPIGPRIMSAAATDDTVYLSNSEGNLFAIDLKSEKVRQLPPRHVAKIMRVGGKLWVLSAVPSRNKRSITRFEVRIANDAGDGPADGAKLPRGTRFAALVELNGEPVVISDRHLWRKDSVKGWVARKTGGVFQFLNYVVAAASADGASLYVGLNSGEHGGGLYRIDPRTGEVASLCQASEDARACGAVTAIIPDKAPGCMLVSFGNSHMGLTEGAVVRACGAQVATVFIPTLPYRYPGGDVDEDPIFGLALSANGFWAACRGHLIHVRGQNPEKIKSPELKRLGGAYLGRDLPGLITSVTDASWAVSVSDYTPLLISITP